MLTPRSIPVLEKRAFRLPAWLSAAETFAVRRRLLIIAIAAGTAWTLFWTAFWIASFLA